MTNTDLEDRGFKAGRAGVDVRSLPEWQDLVGELSDDSPAWLLVGWITGYVLRQLENPPEEDDLFPPMTPKYVVAGRWIDPTPPLTGPRLHPYDRLEAWAEICGDQVRIYPSRVMAAVDGMPLALKLGEDGR